MALGPEAIRAKGVSEVKYAITMFLLRPQQIIDVTLQAEKLGYDSVWLGEHVITPVHNESHFPYGGKNDDHAGFNANIPFFDPYAVFGYLAGITTRVKMGVSVSIVPLHDPFHLSRSITTVDIFSKGRFELGIGTGWLKEEFDILGLDFAKRGKRLEESLDILESLFTNDVTTYDGEHFKVPPIGLNPKPVTQPHPPFIFGGHAPAALRRAALRGDGWMGADLSPEEAAPMVKKMKEMRAEAGRGNDPFDVGCGYRGPLDRDMVQRFEDAGVERLMIAPWTRGREAVDGLARFADAMF
jgi:probable F420-dependent oxidoreductase